MEKEKYIYTSKLHCRLKADGTKVSQDVNILPSDCKSFNIGHFHMDFSAVVFAVLLEAFLLQ